MDHITTILGAGLALALLGMIALALFRQIRGSAKKKSAPDIKQLQNVPHTERLHVTVLEPYCYVSTVGTKSPRAVKHFALRLQDDDGDIRKVDVPEEIYDAFEAGQVGVLTLIDGALHEFVLDEIKESL